jgi:hypothetical protein
MWETGSINPYTFRGMNQMYFINTGDNIKGITFDISSTNAVLNGFGVIYFLYKKLPVMVVICMCTFLLTFSNLITIILLAVMLFLFIFKSNRDQKSMIVVCLTFLIIFLAKVSPENKAYVNEVVHSIFHTGTPARAVNQPVVAALQVTKTPDSLLSPEEKRQKIAILHLDSLDKNSGDKKHNDAGNFHFAKAIPASDKGRVYIPAPDMNAAEFYLSQEMEPDRKRMLDFISINKASLSLSAQTEHGPALPGKVTGIIQSMLFLYRHPVSLVAGSGIGNFSSKIAFRATGLGLRGRYPENHTYINHAFLSNHLDLYMSFFSKEVGARSVMNNPFSVYDQLLTEYGLSGLLALIICYWGFFAKRYKKLTYGIPVLLFVTAIFFIDYWFEQLSVLVLFELMLFLDMKESSPDNIVNYEH